MDSGDDLLPPPNAPMLRHRSFVAGGAKGAAPETLAIDREELPVLTEVVDELTDSTNLADMTQIGEPVAESPPAIAPKRIEALAKELLFERLPEQRQALAEELTIWLDSELPQTILRVLDGIADQLVAQVSAEARAALLPRLQMALEEEPEPPVGDSTPSVSNPTPPEAA